MPATSKVNIVCPVFEKLLDYLEVTAHVNLVGTDIHLDNPLQRARLVGFEFLDLANAVDLVFPTEALGPIQCTSSPSQACPL